jgi:putative ABC transport system permease protein
LQAAALKPADFFGNENILYLMEDMATGEIRLSILWEWIHKQARLTDDDEVTGIKAGERFSLELFHRLLDEELKPFDPPKAGIVLTDYLGKMLGIGAGDTLTVEVLEGSRPTLTIPVTGLVKEYVGVGAYMELTALNRLMGEDRAISGAYFSTEPIKRDWINNELKGMPRVAGTVEQKELVTNIRETMAKQIYIFTFFIIILAAIISFGVVYNSARIALSERQRELASLRVLGFTRAEISYILLGELALLTLVAIPIGFIIGRGLSAFMISKLQTDLFRIPLVINIDSYAFSALVVLVSAVLSGLIVRDKLDHLDLVKALKTKE